MSADLIIVGVQSWCRFLSRAARPATCGLDIDVPLRTSNERPFRPGGATAATMLWPGAMRSGLRRFPAPACEGPRDEKVAVNGAGKLNTIAARLMVAVAPAVAAYAFTSGRSVSDKCTVGTKWSSASNELDVVFTRIIPTPPASRTAKLLAMIGLMPRSHTTILPVTFTGSSTAAAPLSAALKHNASAVGSAPGKPAAVESINGAGPTGVASDAPT